MVCAPVHGNSRNRESHRSGRQSPAGGHVRRATILGFMLDVDSVLRRHRLGMAQAPRGFQAGAIFRLPAQAVPANAQFWSGPAHVSLVGRSPEGRMRSVGGPWVAVPGRSCTSARGIAPGPQPAENRPAGKVRDSVGHARPSRWEPPVMPFQGAAGLGGRVPRLFAPGRRKECAFGAWNSRSRRPDLKNGGMRGILDAIVGSGLVSRTRWHAPTAARGAAGDPRRLLLGEQGAVRGERSSDLAPGLDASGCGSAMAGRSQLQLQGWPGSAEKEAVRLRPVTRTGPG